MGIAPAAGRTGRGGLGGGPGRGLRGRGLERAWDFRTRALSLGRCRLEMSGGKAWCLRENGGSGLRVGVASTWGHATLAAEGQGPKDSKTCLETQRDRL